MSHRAHTERDWSATLLDIKSARLRQTGHCNNHELAAYCHIPFSTMMNLKQSTVLQPLHSTGELILEAYDTVFPKDGEH